MHDLPFVVHGTMADPRNLLQAITVGNVRLQLPTGEGGVALGWSAGTEGGAVWMIARCWRRSSTTRTPASASSRVRFSRYPRSSSNAEARLVSAHRP